MAEMKELSLAHRAFVTAYRWRRLEPIPAARLGRPIERCRVALVSSAGLVTPGDPPFEDTVKGGDWSYRVIAGDADVQQLEEHHRSSSFDHCGIEADRNVGLPLERLRELAAEGKIGEVAPRHVSIMGSITAPGRFLRDTVPAVAELLADDRVDAALLVPV